MIRPALYCTWVKISALSMNEIASFVLKGKISSDTQIRNVLQVVPPPLNMFNWKTTFMQKGVVIDCYLNISQFDYRSNKHST